MPDYQIKISAVDNATPIVDKAFKKTQASATSVSGKIGDRFRDVFENVTQNATGAFGSVAGGLFKLPGPAGIAAAAILAIGGAAVASAKKYAEANAANDTASAQFLANLEGLKKGFGDVVNTIGASVIPIFNSLAEAFGFAGTKADELDAKRKALFDGLKSQREQINAVIENLTLQRESEGAFKPVVDAANQLKQVEAARAQVLEQIQATEKAIASAREEAFKNEGLAFLLDKKTREEFDKKLALQNLSLTPLRAQLENINAQVLAAEELLLKEKALFDQRNTKSSAPEKANTADKIIAQQRQLFKESGDFLTLFSGVQPQLIEGKKEEVQLSVELSDYARDYLDRLREQREAARRVGEAIKNQIGGSIEQAIFSAQTLEASIKNILSDFIKLGIRFVIGRVLGGVGLPGFANGAILNRIPGAANGMLTRSDSLIRVSERNLPEAIIPLAPSQANRRQELLQQANKISGDIFPNSGATYNMTFTAPVIDINFVRNRLVPMLRELSRQGVRIA